MLISTDGGKTWTAGSNQGVQNNQGLAISPSNPNILYLVNLSSGLQQSTDGGPDFHAACYPRSPSRNSAALRSIPGIRPPCTPPIINLLYQSTNAGQTWSQLFAAVSHLAAVALRFARRFACFPGRLHSEHRLRHQVERGWQPGSVLHLSRRKRSATNPPRIAVDETGNAYLTGSTSSANFPTTAGAFQTKLIGASNVFVAKLNPAGSQLIYSTLFGKHKPQCRRPSPWTTAEMR